MSQQESSSSSTSSEPYFRFTSDTEKWESETFPWLLMVIGPPPKGIKWYGKPKRLHVQSPEARQWIEKIVEVCRRSIETSGFMSHYREGYRMMYARKMKNDFVRWCRDANGTENEKARGPEAGGVGSEGD